MRLSSRYALPLAALLSAALVPVGLNAFGGRRDDDCANPEALKDAAAIAGTRVERERKPRSHHKPFVTQWTMGSADAREPDMDAMAIRIMRSFDPKFLYLKPIASVPAAYQLSVYEPELEWMEAGGERVPVHFVRALNPNSVQIGAYLYVYEGRPVEDPFRAQLASALPQLFRGTRPLTVYAVSAYGPREGAEAVQRSIESWLAEAWSRYRAVCS